MGPWLRPDSLCHEVKHFLESAICMALAVIRALNFEVVVRLHIYIQSCIFCQASSLTQAVAKVEVIPSVLCWAGELS